ncbi:MAG: DsbA family protein [Nitrospirales bacterium]|nr:MAG: DsbA family protein [Nitrospirales bacterium]
MVMMSDSSSRSLLYVTDPMCSWCWGFSPVMDRVCQRYQHRLGIEVLVGGLRPGNTERFDEQRRNYILGHWHAVHERTGQSFNFACQMASDFTYDTEPAARAVVAVRHIEASRVFPYLHDVQEAFYVKNLDVTKEAVLADLAQSQGMTREYFLESFRSAELKRTVWSEFDQVRQWGVNGFPTLLAQQNEETTILTHGYQSIDVLAPIIETWLNSTMTHG